MAPLGFENKVAFAWRVADKLRDTFKQHEYGSVMLPLLVLRRMNAMQAPTRGAIVAQAHQYDVINKKHYCLPRQAPSKSLAEKARSAPSGVLPTGLIAA